VPIVIDKGRIDNGSETPIRGYNSLTTNPTNIRNAILKPTENNTVLILLFRFNLRILRTRNPGTKEI
jgi:hypothetical protein